MPCIQCETASLHISSACHQQSHLKQRPDSSLTDRMRSECLCIYPAYSLSLSLNARLVFLRSTGTSVSVKSATDSLTYHTEGCFLTLSIKRRKLLAKKCGSSAWQEFKRSAGCLDNLNFGLKPSVPRYPFERRLNDPVSGLDVITSRRTQ